MTSAAVPSAVPAEFVAAAIGRELMHIRGWAATQGVTILVDYDEALHISDIGRNRDDDATKGNGRKVLNTVLALADSYGLEVEIEHMTDEPGLGTYYASFGFQPHGEPGLITNLRRPCQKLIAA